MSTDHISDSAPILSTSWAQIIQLVYGRHVIFYLIVLLLSWIFYKVVMRPFLSPLHKFPGRPYNNPLLGDLKFLMTGEAMEASLKMVKEYGPFARYYFMFGQERLLVADPESLKHIMVTNSRNYIKPKERMSMIVELLGNGLVMSEGAIHTVHKRLMSAAFNTQSISKMVPVFEARVSKLVNYWKKSIESNPLVDINLDLTRTTLDIIGLTAFGYDFNCLENPDFELGRIFREILSGAGLSFRVMIPYYVHLPVPDMIQFRRNVRKMKSLVKEIIEIKRTQLIQGTDVELVTRDVLGMMMIAKDEQTGEGMTDRELQDQVMTLMLAGHETTAVAMSWCLLMLAQNPTIQEKVRHEIDSIVPEGEPLTYDMIDRLEYCGWVVKETLRFLPPIPHTLRKALSSDVLPGGHIIPSGTIILLAVGPMMRRPELYEDPDRFWPERFENKETEASMYNFLPFLIGPRMCLGYKFALVEMKLMLALLLRNLRFELVDGVTYKRKAGITMRPNPSLKLKVCLVDKTIS